VGDFPAFAALCLAVIVTPGQDTALTFRNTLLGGRVGGVFTALGVTAGQATWTLAASAGLGALLVASGPAFVALKLAGSAYLVVLGAQALFGALRSRDRRALATVEPAKVRPSPARALRQGLLSNLSNPKMLAFFTSLLPQFASSSAGLIIRGAVFCLLTLGWLTACTLAVAQGTALMRRPCVRRAVEALTGATLVGLGLRLATEQRW
jgi:threonine/homoserine/homoserine lactone efflux protein